MRPGVDAAATRGPDRRSRAAGSPRRLIILAAVFVVLAILLVPTLRSYLRQQGQLAALRQQVSQQRQGVAELQREQARWRDNAYVEQQARERLKFVKPGERSYTVLDAEPAAPASGQVAKVAASSKNHPWYGQLWESVQLADSPQHPQHTAGR